MKTVEIEVENIENEDGCFPCPNCKAVLDPDDSTETVYKVIGYIETDAYLETVKLKCNCGQEIHLKGFYPERQRAKKT